VSESGMSGTVPPLVCIVIAECLNLDKFTFLFPLICYITDFLVSFLFYDVNDELEWIWKEAVVACLMYCPGSAQT
jgi:hypothetical protein